MCSLGRIRVNSQRIYKTHHPLKIGDILTFAQGSQVRVIRILLMPGRRGPAAEAQSCYENVSEND